MSPSEDNASDETRRIGSADEGQAPPLAVAAASSHLGPIVIAIEHLVKAAERAHIVAGSERSREPLVVRVIHLGRTRVCQP